MSKRVYELAKEIGVDNASLMKFLTENNIEVKSHMSTLDDSAIAKVKSDFKKPAVKPAPVKAEQKSATESEKVPERPKKKASITAVFNPQNSKNMKDRKPPQKRPMRPAGERPVRPAGGGGFHPEKEAWLRRPKGRGAPAGHHGCGLCGEDGGLGDLSPPPRPFGHGKYHGVSASHRRLSSGESRPGPG